MITDRIGLHSVLLTLLIFVSLPPFYLQILYQLTTLSTGAVSLFQDLQSLSKSFTVFVPVNSAVHSKVTVITIFFIRLEFTQHIISSSVNIGHCHNYHKFNLMKVAHYMHKVSLVLKTFTIFFPFVIFKFRGKVREFNIFRISKCYFNMLQVMIMSIHSLLCRRNFKKKRMRCNLLF